MAVETIENIRTVASLTREQKFYESFVYELMQPYKQALCKAHVVAISFSFSQAIVFYIYALSFWYGAKLIKNNELDFVEVFK